MIDCIQMYWQGAREKEERWFDSLNPILKNLVMGDRKYAKIKYRDFVLYTKQDRRFFQFTSYCD